MWYQFIWQNIHFAVNFFSAFVMFGVFWLYLDAWSEKKPKRDLFKLIGLAILSFSFVLDAAHVEGISKVESIFNIALFQNLFSWSRIIGYLLLIIGLANEPLMKRPNVKGLSAQDWKVSGGIAGLRFQNFIHWLPVNYVWMSLLVGLLYLRKATTGLERHLKPVAYGFLVISFSELLSLASYFQNSKNVDIYKLVTPYGPIWIIKLLTLLLGSILISRWVWKYLITRLQSQLFMIFTTGILIIFLVITAAFSAILLKQIQNAALSQMETSVKVLGYAIDRQQAEMLSDAKVISQNSQIRQALLANQREDLATYIQNYLFSKKLSFVTVVNDQAQVQVRGSDPERFGDSLSSDAYIQRSLLGEEISTVKVDEGLISPQMSVEALVPIYDSDDTHSDRKIIGSVIVGQTINNTFLDGLKKSTGLDASIYGGNVLAASTFVSSDNTSRRLGVVEKSPKINQQVLEAGKTYVGSISLYNLPYYSAYLPLKDSDQITVGMLFVGQPQNIIYKTASLSIEFTFLIAAALILISVYPSYLITKYVVYQLK